MISFNGTLIIQIGNFVVSWWVLDRFFFRRCVALIERERQEVRALEQAVIDQKIESEHIFKLQQESVKKSQDLFARALPATPENLSPKVISSHAFIVSQECDISTQKMLADEVVAVLVKRITHV